MDFLAVDPRKCVRCGACVRDCAFGALKADVRGVPLLAAPEKCMRCQHCLAICPTGAVTLDGKTAADCPSAVGAELPSPAAVRNWLALRRSVRSFADEDVAPDLIDGLLRTLGNTPTGCNARHLTFTCFPDRAAMGEVRRCFLATLAAPHERLLPRWLAVPALRLRKGGQDIFFRGAAGMLIVSSDTGHPAVTTPREDVTIACSNFELLANANGIGTCWFGFLGMIESALPGFVETLAGVPRGHAFAAMLFGNPAVRYSRGVAREDYANIVYRRVVAE